MSYLLSAGNGVRRFGEDTHRLARLLIICGVMLASGYLVPKRPTQSLVAMAGLASALLFLACPPLGLVALVPVSLLFPFELGTGTDSTINATMLLLLMLVGLWAMGGLARRDLRIFTSRPVLPFVSICIVAALSFLGGNQALLDFARPAPLPAQLGALAVFILSLGAFLLASQQLRDVRWLQVLTWLYIALGGVYILARLMPLLDLRIEGIFQRGATAHSLFWVWLVALAFSQAVFNRSLRLVWRLALLGLAVATLYVALSQAPDWTSGWLPAAVALVVILLVGRPRLGLPVAAAGGVILGLENAGVTNFMLAGDNDYSLITRLEAWRIVGEIIKINPVLGLGPANYYWYTPLFSILGWNVSFNSHNNYVDIVAQIGFLGLACFLWFVWELGRLGFRLKKQVSDGFCKAYVYGALGGLAGTLVAGMFADWFLPFVYNIGLSGFRTSVLGWVFLGGLAALGQTVSDRPDMGQNEA